MPVSTFDKITATFAPKRADDLRPNAEPGWRGEWQAMWEIEDGPYSGQWAWMAYESRMGWVPTEDLADVEPS